jgi:hypothetical protein
MVSESGSDMDQMILSTKQIVQNCIVDADVDVDTMAYYNIEYLLLRLRALSISPTLQLMFDGLKDSTCETCKQPSNVVVKLDTVDVVVPDGFSPKITLADTSGPSHIIMKEPSYETMRGLLEFNKINKIEPDYVLNFLALNIKEIFNKNAIYQANELTTQQLIEFLEGLSLENFSKVENWFANLPQLYHRIDMHCPTCGHHQYYELVGLDSFLD